jgi:predicted esterase
MKINNKSLVLLIVSLSAFFTSNSQSSLPEGYENRFIDDFRYGVYVPPDYNPGRKYHLVVFLHGYTDTTSWNLQWYDPEIQKEYPSIVLTPKCPVYYKKGWGSSWDMKESYAIGKTFQAIDTLLKQYSIDTSKIHIYGHSLGGVGVFYALARYPGMFASAYTVCGAGNPVVAPLLTETPLWIFHGSEDGVIPVEQSRNMYEAIKVAGSEKVHYTEYSGVKHDSWDNVNREGTLPAWFLGKTLSSSQKLPGYTKCCKVKPSKITVHSSGKIEIPVENEPGGVKLEVFPLASINHLVVRVVLMEEKMLNIRIIDIHGSTVRTIYKGKLSSGSRTFDMNLPFPESSFHRVELKSGKIKLVKGFHDEK